MRHTVMFHGKLQILSNQVRMLTLLGAMALGLGGCFILTHDPGVHERGAVTTTTGADLDGGSRGTGRDVAARPRNPSSSELNDLTHDLL
jgi:hypothetical protein